ncbi:hypothetical protein ACA910_008000 [Epithemia clementina (nom. ined.)]
MTKTGGTPPSLSSSSSCNIIFLDIDGVILPFPTFTEGINDKGAANVSDNNKKNTNNNEDARLFPDATLQALSHILEQLTQQATTAVSTLYNPIPSYVVLSSTWRVQPRYIAMIERSFHNFGLRRHEPSRQEQSQSSSTANHFASSSPLLNFQFLDITNPQLHSERQHEIYDWLVHKTCNYSNQHHEKQHPNNSCSRGSRNNRHCNNKSSLSLSSLSSPPSLWNVKAWIALDDEELVDGKANQRHQSVFQGHVVKTNSYVGLTMDDAQRAIELLQSQIQNDNNKQPTNPN